MNETPVSERLEFAPRATRYCFAVIVLNEGDRLRGQLQRMQPLARLADIIIADGGSTDGSTEAAFLQAMQVRTLLVTKEKGLCTALRMAYGYALEQGYDGIVTIDGNGKDGVGALPAFLATLEAGYDLVQGSRFMRGGHHRNTPLERYIGVRYLVAPVLATGGFYFTDPTNGFRAVSARFLSDARVQPLRHCFKRFNLQHYLNWRAAKLGCRIVEIPVTRVYPDDGSVPTKITHWRTKSLFLKELAATVLGRYNPSAPPEHDQRK